MQIEAVLDPASPATKNASNAFFLKGKSRGVFGSLRDEGTLYKVGRCKLDPSLKATYFQPLNLIVHTVLSS